MKKIIIVLLLFSGVLSGQDYYSDSGKIDITFYVGDYCQISFPATNYVAGRWYILGPDMRWGEIRIPVAWDFIDGRLLILDPKHMLIHKCVKITCEEYSENAY